jgi:trimeric autotransporter adhesin
MATTTTNFGWDIPQSTDLVKDGATAIAALGQDIDTALVDLKGGTTGQVLSKATNADLDYSWVTPQVGDITAVTAGTGISGGGTTGDITITNSMATAIDAKGDLIAGTGADAFARLAVGTNGQILTADSSTATGLKWGTAGATPKILQVVSATKADTFSTTSTSMVDVTGLSVSITPTSATSTFLVFMNVMNSHSSGSNAMNSFNLVRNSTAIAQPSTGTDIATTQSNVVASSYLVNAVGFTVDSPATGSAITYKVQMRVTNTTTGFVNRRGDNSAITAVSSLYVMEIGA